MGKPSETAQRTAFARAWESYLSAETRVCFDPIAKHLLAEEWRLAATTEEGRESFSQEVITPNPVLVAVWEYVVLRTRVIDALLQDYAQNGMAQLLILGAGFDSRAYRFPELVGKVKVLEVDDPDTQEFKKTGLSEHFGSLPDHVGFVPLDFEKHDLAASLAQAGFDRDLKTLVIWEGVTYYLEPRAVDQTLAFVAGHTPAGSSIIFDHILEQAIEGKCRNPLLQAFIQNVAEIGEPCKFGLDPEQVDQFLTQRGFGDVTNLTVAQCKEKYLQPVHADRKPIEGFSIAQASVA
jgi:methyltransferase (TIGR00027 family)